MRTSRSSKKGDRADAASGAAERLQTTLWGAVCLAGAELLLLAAPAAVAQRPSESLRLVPGVAVERTLTAGEADLFQAELAAGKPWRFRVEQLGIDVVVEVKDPWGKSLLTVDSPLGREGFETLLLTPVADGLYGVEVRCEEKGAPGGSYEIRLDELPVTTSADRLRLRAQEATTEAGRLFRSKEEGAKERAVAELREALEAWGALGDLHRQAWTWFLIGGFSDELEDYRQSVAGYAKALGLWRRLKDPSGEAAALDRLGLAQQVLGEHGQALRYLEEALELRQRLGRRGLEAETRNHLCLTLQRLGRFHPAGDCYEETLAVAREVGDRPLAATLLSNLGGIYQNLGEPAKTLAQYQQALELQRALGDEMGQAITFNNLGFYHHGLGEFEEALLLYAPALAIFERFGNRYWQARILNNIGFAYLALGELERARSYLLRALPLRRAVGDQAGEAVTLRNLGRASSGLGEAEEAMAFFRQALDNSLARGDQRGAVTARKLLGELLTAQHQPAAARQELELALSSLRQMDHRPEVAEVLELLSRLHLAAGDLPKAQALAAEALDLHRAVRNPTGEIAAQTTLARIERQLGHALGAQQYLDSAFAALEALHGHLGDPNQKASFLASQREVYELQVDFLMELHRRSPAAGHDRKALEASERAHSRSLLALLVGTGAGLGPTVGAALKERLRAAERRFAAKTRLQLQVLGQEHTAAEASAAEQELYGALAELDNVRAEIRRLNPRYASLGGAETLATSAIRDLLDDDTVLLEFFLSEERSFLWWVTPASVTAYELPPRTEIEALAGEVYRQVSEVHGPTGATREALGALGRMLLGPVADQLEDQRLVIVADGALHLLPFAALTLPAGAGAQEPVIVRHEVVHLPSASVLAAQRQELASRFRAKEGSATGTPAIKAPVTVAILADPIFDRQDPRIRAESARETRGRGAEAAKRKAGGRFRGVTWGAPRDAGRDTALDTTRDGDRLRLDELDRLPNTRREAEAIAAQVPAERLFLALGSDARRSRVVDDELKSYGILHFATHGFINPRVPELSGLVLSQVDAAGREIDGFLGLYDVSNLELSAELVVLSGCGTALGKEVRGEGLVGLTRGFLYAGVPRVVASLWQVRDQATAELMARFYRAMLAESSPPAAALRAAQLALRQERRWRDPYFWAAFTLQGDWR